MSAPVAPRRSPRRQARPRLSATACASQNSRQGGRPKSAPARRGISRCKSLRPGGIRRRQRRNRVGPSFHRWYEADIGSYTRPDPAGLIRSNLDLYGYALRNPVRFVDPYGLATCVVISAATVFELADRVFAFGDHSALLVTGPCRPSESCPSGPGPLLYDPAGGYSA